MDKKIDVSLVNTLGLSLQHAGVTIQLLAAQIGQARHSTSQATAGHDVQKKMLALSEVSNAGYLVKSAEDSLKVVRKSLDDALALLAKDAERALEKQHEASK